jgi:hypothetical protein
LDKETQTWKEKGHGIINQFKICPNLNFFFKIEWTKAETGWKYFKLLEENEKIKKGSARLEGVSVGPGTILRTFFFNKKSIISN